MRWIVVLLLAIQLGGIASALSQVADSEAFPVAIRIDARRPGAELRPIWRFFGADEPNYATMKDGQKLLRSLGELAPGSVYFRAHNLLTSGDGTPALKWGSTNAYTEDDQGRPVYDWTIVDRIFDTYLERGVRPFVEIGFMPQALSTRKQPYRQDWRPGFDYTALAGGWAFPPTDYEKWENLVYEWVRHCVARYGHDEVATWYFETWNEPNYPAYWFGTVEEFQKLHDHAIHGVRRALPGARVGGPDTAGDGGEFMDEFLAHIVSGTNYATGETGTPVDFLSFHAKGQATFVDGHVRLDMGAQLRTIDTGLARIAAVPALADKPVILGESDPEGCAACQGAHLAYRNGTMYSSYTAASFARKHELADRHGVKLEGALTWAFEFEDQRYFAGFRALASNGLDLPVLNVFRMFSRMQGRRLPAESTGAVSLDAILKDSVRGQADVAAFASSDARALYVMVWHYHDDDVPGPDARVSLIIHGLDPKTAAAGLSHYRIDRSHSNAYAAWQRLGEPVVLDEQEYAAVESAGRLQLLAPASRVPLEAGIARLSFDLPRQAVLLLVLVPEGA
jgi:xylan 1,4-beta-xylosidase